MSIPANVIVDRKVTEDRIKDILETKLDAIQLMTVDNDLVENGSYNVAREQGLVRIEGKDYIVKDGDVMLFRFNV